MRYIDELKRKFGKEYNSFRKYMFYNNSDLPIPTFEDFLYTHYPQDFYKLEELRERENYCMQRRRQHCEENKKFRKEDYHINCDSPIFNIYGGYM